MLAIVDLTASFFLEQGSLRSFAFFDACSTPGFVAALVIRTPEQVAASIDKRELTAWALYVPILPCFVLVGLFILHRKEKKAQKEADVEPMPADELTGLVQRTHEGRRSSVQIVQEFSRKSEVARRFSNQIMGIPGFDTNQENIDRRSSLAELNELVRLGELDFGDEETSMK
jgi:hypothetical protein